MKILVLSDLHLDYQPFPVMQDGIRVHEHADVVVLAGDIDEGVNGFRWARETFPHKAIIYVAGNHEFYRHHWTHHLDSMREAALKYKAWIHCKAADQPVSAAPPNPVGQIQGAIKHLDHCWISAAHKPFDFYALHSKRTNRNRAFAAWERVTCANTFGIQTT